MKSAARNGLSALITALLVAASGAVAAKVLDLSVEHVPTILGEAPGEQFGYSVAAGDIDGDGEIELVVGAPGHAVAGEGPHVGAVYVFDRAVIVGLDAPAAAREIARAVISGSAAYGRFGEALAVADVDGDSISDLIVGAPSWSSGGGFSQGSAYVFTGGLWASQRSRADDAAHNIITGDSAGDRLGSSVCAADLDGDGVADFLVSAFRASPQGAAGAGAVYLVDGDSLCSSPGEGSASELARSVIAGAEWGDALRGLAIADTDGDGSPEIVVGAYFADGPGAKKTDIGKVYLVDPAVLARDRVVSLAGGGLATILGHRPRGLLGRSIAAGDLDSDGVDDLVIAAYASRGEATKADASGEVYVIFGRREGIRGALDLSREAVPTFRYRSRWDLFGLPVATGDINGDRSPDIVIAAQFADSPDGSRQRCGEVYVYWGGLRSVIDAKAGDPEMADIVIVGAHRMDALGGALAAFKLTEGRGSDLAIGAPDATAPAGDDLTGKVHVITSGLLLSR